MVLYKTKPSQNMATPESEFITLAYNLIINNN